MSKKLLALILLAGLLLLLAGCAQVEVAVKVDSQATIPRARVVIYTQDYTVFDKARAFALQEYKKLSPEDREFISLQEKKDAPPYAVAWVWDFSEHPERVKEFTEQFLGEDFTLTKDGDLVILKGKVEGESLESSLQGTASWGIKPFLSSVELLVKAYMPGEILSFVDGQVDGTTWYQTFNLGQLLRDKSVVDIEVIARDK
jgi:hypothetical protein